MKKNKKRIIILSMLVLTAVVLIGIKFTLFSGSKVLANPDKEIFIDEGLTPDIAMTIPKDATNLIEPELDKVLYKDYVQGNMISRKSTKNIMSVYSSRANFNGTVLGSANNIIPLPSGGFIAVIYDAQSVPAYGRRVMYYLDNDGAVLGYYDVVQAGTRFEDITNLNSYEKDGKFYFSIMGVKDYGTAVLYNMSLDISSSSSVPTNQKFKEEGSAIPVGVRIADSSFTKIYVSSANTEQEVTFSKVNPISSDETFNNSEFIHIEAPFRAYDTNTKSFSAIKQSIELYNPAQKSEGNLSGYPGFEINGGSSVAIDRIEKINDDNYLITSRAYRYKANSTTNEYIEVKSVSLYDKELKFKKKLYVSSVGNGVSGTVETISYFPKLDDLGNSYFYAYSSVKEGNLFKVDVTSESIIENKKTYPVGTSLLMSGTGDVGKYSYILNTKGDIPELSTFGITPLNNSRFIISGDMNEDFSIKNISILNMPDGDYTLNKIIPLNDENSNTNFAFFGTLRSSSPDLDKVFTQQLPVNSFNKTNYSYSYFGTFARSDDYAPILKKMTQMIYNIDKITDKKDKDEQLLKDVTVYDTVDSNSLFYGQKWLENRIQKNINTLDSATNEYTQVIDWKSLGFEDNGKVGPNKVTYFAADSNLSITSTSRTVNKVDSKTEYDETVAKSALHAQNFAIKLDDLKRMQDSGGLTAAALTEAGTTDSYGHVLAWNLNTGDNLNAQVQVDAKELAIINGAKGFGQYPLTYTLKDEQGNLLLTKDETPLKRETIVYVLDKNSQVVGEKGNTTVFNTEDFTLPWDSLQELKADKDPQALLNKIKSEGKVIAYDFDTGEEIPTADIAPVSDDVESLKLLEPSNKVGATDAQKKPTQAIHYTIKRNTGTEEISLTTTTYTTVTVIYRFATVTLAVKDEESQALYDLSDQERTIPAVTITNQIVGKTLDFTTEQAISDAKEVATIIPKTETEPAKSTGYEFDGYYDANNTTPLTNSTSVLIKYKATDAQTDPNLYTMRFKGLLYLNVPETMSFGTEKIRAFTQTVKPEKDNTALIVGDHRKVGTVKDTDKKGQWKVTVKLASDFVQEGENAPTLENILYYNDVLVPKNEAIMIQTTKKGSTKTEIPLNDTSSFRLKIPTGSAVTGKYQGSLTWNVLNAP